MSKLTRPGKSTVPLERAQARPSRIRREPPPPTAPTKQVAMADVAEREAWTVIIGVLMFAVAISIIILGISDYTSK